jgi:hypothetical protein
MPLYDVIVYPRWFEAEVRDPKIVEVVKELEERYRSALREADERFEKEPPEARTPKRYAEILMEEFKRRGCAFIFFEGLEAADRKEARELATGYARFVLLHRKFIPRDLWLVIEHDYDAVVLPVAKGRVVIDPPPEGAGEAGRSVATAVLLAGVGANVLRLLLGPRRGTGAG